MLLSGAAGAEKRSEEFGVAIVWATSRGSSCPEKIMNTIPAHSRTTILPIAAKAHKRRFMAKPEDLPQHFNAIVPGGRNHGIIGNMDQRKIAGPPPSPTRHREALQRG